MANENPGKLIRFHAVDAKFYFKIEKSKRTLLKLKSEKCVTVGLAAKYNLNL